MKRLIGVSALATMGLSYSAQAAVEPEPVAVVEPEVDAWTGDSKDHIGYGPAVAAVEPRSTCGRATSRITSATAPPWLLSSPRSTVDGRHQGSHRLRPRRGCCRGRCWRLVDNRRRFAFLGARRRPPASHIALGDPRHRHDAQTGRRRAADCALRRVEGDRRARRSQRQRHRAHGCSVVLDGFGFGQRQHRRRLRAEITGAVGRRASAKLPAGRSPWQPQALDRLRGALDRYTSGRSGAVALLTTEYTVALRQFGSEQRLTRSVQRVRRPQPRNH